MARRRRKRSYGGEDAEISMSSLIDCVFLLLIFFLATTMFKRKESMIPFVLPDDTSSLGVSLEESRMHILIARSQVEPEKLAYYKPGGVFNAFGAAQWQFIGRATGDLSKYLQRCIEEDSECRKAPLVLETDGDIEFQKAIVVLDVCKLMGFENVSIRTVPRKTIKDLRY